MVHKKSKKEAKNEMQVKGMSTYDDIVNEKIFRYQGYVVPCHKKAYHLLVILLGHI